MVDGQDLLEKVKNIAKVSGNYLCKVRDNKIRVHEFHSSVPREMKAVADQVLEGEILKELIPLGLPILSEESGDVYNCRDSELRFIVDPLDGTVNFVRGLGEASISIALYQGEKPIFGVLSLYPSGDLVWGGKGLGAFTNDQPIQVSDISNMNHSVLCTGIPSRFDFELETNVNKFLDHMESFAKVRMLGAASISLLRVAEGSAEAYMEKEIMLWDVAAGLAIVEGAGGNIKIESGSVEGAFNVAATNGVVSIL